MWDMLDNSVTASTEISDRVETVQAGRLTMERITQGLRAQVCPNSTNPAIESGTDNSVTFYSDLAGESARPDKRVVSYDATAKTLTDQLFQASGSAPSWTYPPSPTRTSVATGLVPATGVPVFRYYAFTATPPATPTVLLPTPLSATDRARTVKISVSFVARPRRTSTDPKAETTFQNDVFVRTADPTAPGGGPRCF
jgi:hypothetical protein